MVARLGVVLILSFGLSQGLGKRDLNGQEIRGERTFLEVKWDTLFLAGGTAEDTTLLIPDGIQIAGDQVAVIDGTNRRISAFDRRDGTLEWIYATGGRGPLDLGYPSDKDVDLDQSLLILDQTNQKILSFNAFGVPTYLGRLPSSARPVRRFVVGPDSTIGLISPRPVSPIRIMDRRRNTLSGSITLPWNGEAPERIHHIPKTSSGPDGSWVIAKRFGPYFFLKSPGQRTAQRFAYIDSVPFRPIEVGKPSVRGGVVTSAPIDNPTPLRYAALDASIASGRLYILFGVPEHDPSGYPSSVLDVYSLQGTYLHSLALPMPCSALQTDGRDFFLLSRDPIPRLLGVRINGSR